MAIRMVLLVIGLALLGYALSEQSLPLFVYSSAVLVTAALPKRAYSRR